MADFTSKHNLKASLHFSSRRQYTNLARHGNEQLDTTILESQKENQNPYLLNSENTNQEQREISSFNGMQKMVL